MCSCVGEYHISSLESQTCVVVLVSITLAILSHNHVLLVSSTLNKYRKPRLPLTNIHNKPSKSV